MPINPKVKQIYDTLKEGGADVGSEKEFNDYFFAKGKDGYNNRKEVFNTLKEGGADAGKSYEEFAGWLGLHAVSPHPTQTKPAPPQRTVQAARPVPPRRTRPQQPQRSKGKPMTAAEKARVISNVRGIVRGTQAGLRRTQNMMTYAKSKAGLHVEPVKLGQKSNVVETAKQYDPKTGKMQPHYLTEAGNEYDDKVQADMEQAAIDEQKRRELDPVQSQLEDAYGERDRLEEAIRKRRKELEDEYNSRPWYQRMLTEMGKAAHSDMDPAATATDPEHMGFEQDEQYMQLMSAIRKNHQTIQTLEDKKNGRMNSFWHSLGTALTNGYTFADGLPEMRDATAMLNAQKHIDSINRKRQTGQALTKEEEAAEAVLRNTMTDNAVQGTYGSEYGAWGRAGSGMAQSIDFMKDFLLLPGAGSIAKGVAGKVAGVGGKYLAKKAGETAVKAAAKAIARATLKATGVVAGAHAAGAVISNTTGIGRTAAKMGQLGTGDVGMDKNGNYKMENQKDLMRAFAEAEREQARENGSEMFGEFIPGGKALSGVAKKALSKIGLGRISDMLTRIGNKAWYKNYTDLLSKGGYNGIPGEALEEYEGMFFDAITGHADEAVQDFTDPKQQVDIWLGCATMGALMGAVPMGLHIQGYYRYKHGMDRADRTADFRLTPEKWQPLKEQIDQTDNGNMSGLVVDNILNNKKLEPQEKEAVMDYVRNLTKFRGFNIAQVNNAEEAARGLQAEDRQQDEDRQQAYETGREAADMADTDGDRSDADAIVLHLREAYGEIERVFGDDAEMRLARLEDDPWEVMDDQSLTPEQQDAVAYFVNSKAAMDGLTDAVDEKGDNKRDEATRQIEQRTNRQSGMIHPATLKVDDKQVYIVSGNVTMFPDGSAVDVHHSSESVVVCDAETGELKFISPEQICKVDDPVDPSMELKAVDGAIHAERQTILGNEAETEVSESEETPGQSEDERPRPVQQGTAAGEVQAEGTALERIPKDGNGQPLLEQTDPETAWDGVVEYMEDADDAKEYVDSMVARLSKEAEAAAKAVGKIKPAGSMAQFKADKAAARQVQADAEARLELWKQIADVDRKRRYAAQTAEQEKRAARETEIHQQAVKAEERRRQEELQKRAEQSERGANNVASVIREKWNTAPKIDGAPNEIVLPNGERVGGHYVLTESGAASPSHNATAEFAKTEGFPVDGNGQSVNDRDYERDRDAQAVTRSIARNYDSRAMQSPVVVSKDGVVLSGNGRTMAGELAAADNTDVAYVEYLQKYPQQYGFTPEQVQGMQHPRVVFVPDADMPYNAETFAKFNQQEMKGQSKTEQAVKLGKVVDDTAFAHITRAINGYDTLGEFYADSKAAHAAVKELQTAGVLTHAQMAEMSDGEGLSAQGKEVLENMLIGKAFESNPDAIREITAFKSGRQSVITALAEIVNNKSLGEDYSLEYELAQAVDLVYKARKANHKAGDRVSSFARQQNLFSFDEGDTVADYNNATMLMLADVLNDNRSTQLKKILAVYNQKAADSAAGQTDMFSGGVKTNEEIWNEVKQLIDYGTEEEQQQAVREAAERRKESVLQDEPLGRSDEGSGEVRLSDEIDENGRQFVLTSDGSLVFGEIGAETGLAAAPILLSEGMITNPMTNDGYGLVHIEARHGNQIRKAGYKSVVDFVEKVGENYNVIKEGNVRDGHKTYRLQMTDGHNNTLMVELSNDGAYWNINTAGIFKTSYGKNNKEVYNRHTTAKQPVEAVGTSQDAEQSDTQTSSRMGVPTSSFGKDIKESDTKQEKPEKFVPSAKRAGENILDYAARVAEEHHAHKVRKAEEAKVDTHPTEAQKASGNYKKGHIRVDGLDITIEQPKGSIRRGKDANGKEWESEMHSTYGYIRGTKGTDGDHIDVYLSDNPTAGNVYVVDQVNQQTGAFDEHKVMYGFGSMEEAVQAYRDQYEDGWKVGTVTEVSREEFKKWVESSTRKTKPFAEYKSVKPLDSEHAQPGGNYAHNSEEIMRDDDVKPADSSESYTITPTQYTNKKGKTSDMYLVKFNRELSKEEKAAAKAFVNAPLAEGRRTTKGWYTRVQEGYVVRSKEAAKQLGDMMADEVAVADEQPLTVQDYRNAAAPAVHKEQEKKPSDTVSAEDTAIQDAEAKVHSPEHKDSGLDFNGDISKEDFNDALKDLRSLLGVSDDEGEAKYAQKALDELKEYQRKTDTTGRTSVDEKGFDPEDLFVPLLLDGKPSRAGVLMSIPDRITDPSGQVAVYDFSNDDEGNADWQKWDDLAEEYNKNVSREEKAYNNGDVPILRFKGVDAAVKFVDWLNSTRNKKPFVEYSSEKFGSIDEVTDRVLYDLANGTDLKGVRSEQRQFHKESTEEQDIIERAKSDGTYMKAPNGKPTNLNEKQWGQVRTRAFKDWFGDWEKAARIEKLRRSKPVKITGEEIVPSDDLKQYKKNALEYGKKLRGEYTNEDTGESIALTGGNSRGGIREILQHDYKDTEHLQSIAAIPQIIKKSIFIDEIPNEDVEKYSGVKSFRYYVCGVKIGSNDYTVKAVVAVQNNGDRYYDHKLSSIEKGKLLSIIPTIQKAGIENNLPPSVSKDKRLFSILQTNSSKVLDENGEPMVVYHGTLVNGLHQFNRDFIGSRYSYDEKGFFFISNENIAKDYATSEFDANRKGEVIGAYLSLKSPLIVNSEWCRKNGLGSNVFKNNDVIEFWDNYQTLMVEKSEQSDGVIITDGETSMVVAFTPNQIKSATSNNGNFSTTEDDIRYRTVSKGEFDHMDYSPSRRAAEAKIEKKRLDEEYRKLSDEQDKPSANEDTRYRDFDEEVNEQFNRELAELTEENADTKIFNLGSPSSILLSAGVEDKPMKLYGSKLMKKAKLHGFSPKELQNLPAAVADPIAVFDNYKKTDNRSILTELKTKDGNFLVSLTIGKGIDVDFNIIASAFGKANDSIVKWINKGFATYINKEKALNYLYLSAPIAEAAENSELSSAANIVNNFVNPNIGEEKKSLQGKMDPQDTTPQAKALQAKVLSEKLNTPIRVVSDPEEIAGLPSRRQQRAKGWWSAKNDEVVILLPNNADAADVTNTVVHEVVGHKGLRKLIGEERFDEFLNEVYDHASKPIRAAIDQAERKLFDAEVDRLTQQKNAEADRPESRKGVFSRAEATVEANRKREQMRREATEEYMADMAGRIGDEGFEKMSAEELTFWGKVKARVQQFLDKFLRGLKIAKRIRLTDKDVAYILYKSWKNLRNGGKPTVMDAAEDALMRSKTHYDEIPENDVMFRDGDSVEYSKAQARNLYEQRVSRGLYQMQEAIQDSMLGLKEAMEAVLKAEGGYTGRIEDVAGYENPYLGENRLSSVNQAECAAFAQTLFKPMLEEVAKLAKTAKERAELTDYMMAKHGLERNEVMARRAAEKVAHDEFWKELKAAEHTVANDPLDQDAADVLADVKQRMQDRENELYAENRSRDYVCVQPAPVFCISLIR